MSHFYIITLGLEEYVLNRSSPISFLPGESAWELYQRALADSTESWRESFDLDDSDVPAVMFWSVSLNEVPVPGIRGSENLSKTPRVNKTRLTLVGSNDE